MRQISLKVVSLRYDIGVVLNLFQSLLVHSIDVGLREYARSRNWRHIVPSRRSMACDICQAYLLFRFPIFPTLLCRRIGPSKRFLPFGHVSEGGELLCLALHVVDCLILWHRLYLLLSSARAKKVFLQSKAPTSRPGTVEPPTSSHLDFVRSWREPFWSRWSITAS